jgi:hypothetical protein
MVFDRSVALWVVDTVSSAGNGQDLGFNYPVVRISEHISGGDVEIGNGQLPVRAAGEEGPEQVCPFQRRSGERCPFTGTPENSAAKMELMP